MFPDPMVKEWLIRTGLPSPGLSPSCCLSPQGFLLVPSNMHCELDRRGLPEMGMGSYRSRPKTGSKDKQLLSKWFQKWWHGRGTWDKGKRSTDGLRSHA